MTTFQHDYFERAVDRWPDAIAVEDGEARITYLDLEKRANRIAHLLQELGVGPNARVCIATGKNKEMYAALLGALKSGGCWVPLSHAFPHDRLKYLVDSLNPSAVIAEPDTASTFLELAGSSPKPFPVIVLGGEAPGTIGEKRLELCADTRPVIRDLVSDDLAYIIFTSGSTGTPKGVMVLHRNSTQFLDLCPGFFAIPPGSRFAHFSELTFDPSVFDLFHCWAVGGTLVPFNRRSWRINPSLFLDEARVDVLFTVPSVISSLRDMGKLASPGAQTVKHLLLTGEAVPARLVRQWYESNPNSTVYNMYGTTETAIVSHWCVLPSNIDPDQPAPVGKVLPGTRILLLDGDRPVKEGEVGESVVCSAQLSPGYWANPYQTQAAFVRNPLEPQLPQTAYRTGDLLRRDSEGMYFFVGRADSQVKVRGHRVELGEIESLLLGFEQVREAVVVAVSPSGDGYDNRLIAYVKLDGAEAGPEQLGKHLAAQLPAYMVPSQIEIIEGDMPRNANGKIDRSALQGLAKNSLLSRRK
ncbi:MAG: amino acid adenylation domain-containing protein [Alphaproteobacteria bacterium]|nr:amino acid adenylation domain-containing protein [Alphaproteobacteria bacterium]